MAMEKGVTREGAGEGGGRLHAGSMCEGKGEPGVYNVTHLDKLVIGVCHLLMMGKTGS